MILKFSPLVVFALALTTVNSACVQESLTGVPEWANYCLLADTGVMSTAKCAPTGGDFPYIATHSDDFINPITRVAYYFEWDGSDTQTDYVWVSYDAMPLSSGNLLAYGIPVLKYNGAGGFRASYPNLGLSNVNVYSNHAGVESGTSLTTINAEFWPSNYGQGWLPSTGHSARFYGASDSYYDADDSFTEGQQGYGCFQVHNHQSGGIGPHCIFAFNRFHDCGNNDVGIGNYGALNAANNDWTFVGRGDSKPRIRIFLSSDGTGPTPAPTPAPTTPAPTTPAPTTPAPTTPAPTPVPTTPAPTTPSPTQAPTSSPTSTPTSAPTAQPTASPTASPSAGPTSSPTPSPTQAPTPSPTSAPTSSTSAPSAAPSPAPTPAPPVSVTFANLLTAVKSAYDPTVFVPATDIAPPDDESNEDNVSSVQPAGVVFELASVRFTLKTETLDGGVAVGAQVLEQEVTIDEEGDRFEVQFVVDAAAAVSHNEQAKVKSIQFSRFDPGDRAILTLFAAESIVDAQLAAWILERRSTLKRSLAAEPPKLTIIITHDDLSADGSFPCSKCMLSAGFAVTMDSASSGPFKVDGFDLEPSDADPRVECAVRPPPLACDLPLAAAPSSALCLTANDEAEALDTHEAGFHQCILDHASIDGERCYRAVRSLLCSLWCKPVAAPGRCGESLESGLCQEPCSRVLSHCPNLSLRCNLAQHISPFCAAPPATCEPMLEFIGEYLPPGVGDRPAVISVQGGESLFYGQDVPSMDGSSSFLPGMDSTLAIVRTASDARNNATLLTMPASAALFVPADVVLNGTLNFQLDSLPADGDIFSIVSSGTGRISGEFSRMNLVHSLPNVAINIEQSFVFDGTLFIQVSVISTRIVISPNQPLSADLFERPPIDGVTGLPKPIVLVLPAPTSAGAPLAPLIIQGDVDFGGSTFVMAFPALSSTAPSSGSDTDFFDKGPLQMEVEGDVNLVGAELVLNLPNFGEAERSRTDGKPVFEISSSGEVTGEFALVALPPAVAQPDADDICEQYELAQQSENSNRLELIYKRRKIPADECFTDPLLCQCLFGGALGADEKQQLALQREQESIRGAPRHSDWVVALVFIIFGVAMIFLIAALLGKLNRKSMQF